MWVEMTRHTCVYFPISPGEMNLSQTTWEHVECGVILSNVSHVPYELP